MAVPALVVSPIVAVLEQVDLPSLDARDRAGTAGVAVSLVEAFERVPDPRRARGIRHPLVPLLVVAACAVMTGARSFAAIGEYARDKGRLVFDALGVDGAVAHPATIRRVLVEVDPAGLQEAITAWSVPGGQHSDAGGELGGHVHSGDPVGGQPGGQGGTQPADTLDRPHGGGPGGGEAAQVAVGTTTPTRPLRVNRHPDRGQRPQ